MYQGYDSGGAITEGLGHPVKCPGNVEKHANSSDDYRDDSITGCLRSHHRRDREKLGLGELPKPDH